MQSQSLRSNILVIIPAAGYGTRVGSPEAKEMLPRKSLIHPASPAPYFESDQYEKLIDWPLWLCAQSNLKAHIITRREKKNLLSYLGDLSSPELFIQKIAPTQDWPETILRSKEYWREWNILLLPDIEFAPVSQWNHLVSELEKEMQSEAQEFDVIALTHTVTHNKHLWGYLFSENNSIIVAEKINETNFTQAWGVYAFKKSIGEKLLKAQLTSTLEKRKLTLHLKLKTLPLAQFNDLTR